MANKELGAIYISFGEKFVDESETSAKSFKSNNPSIPVTLFTDIEYCSHVFNKIHKIDKKEFIFLERIKLLKSFPYDYNIYLDSDTLITGNLKEIFELLYNFDIAVSHAPFRKTLNIEGVSDAFPEPNCGVIGFKKSEKVYKLFNDWEKNYIRDLNDGLPNPHNLDVLNSKTLLHDQISLRKALYNSDIRIATLTPEYNCRCDGPVYLNDKVKIIHSSYSDLKYITYKINKKLGRRVYIPHIGCFERNSIIFKFLKKISEYIKLI